jgi:hypothetical protein
LIVEVCTLDEDLSVELDFDGEEVVFTEGAGIVAEAPAASATVLVEHFPIPLGITVSVKYRTTVWVAVFSGAVVYRVLVWTGVMVVEPSALLQTVVDSGVDVVEIVVDAMAGTVTTSIASTVERTTLVVM